ncbi:PREDICTED: RNA-binding protein 25-like [Camelina sativa]|uniref:RNA-binding protein 25-like n=1 Tax=Camelina sativa TaxID=90675 RepID=A0ABM0ZN00_CAMSA|nr:PREDICTED: RNA-binding protein 25-like [Camelina sativa]
MFVREKKSSYGRKKKVEQGRRSMNVDNTNNNDYICTNDCIEEDDDNNTNNKRSQTQQAWGTWEELLLACAVKRHGYGDWDSVATDVRSRSSLSDLVSANHCKHKYRDLKRRFHEKEKTDAAATAEDEEEKVGNNNISWLEQLRNLRVAELRREVERYDVSILSLQLKVKKLEEEREEEKPDLEEEMKTERSENDGSETEHREKAEESDRDNGSMNESNSTETVGEDERVGGNETRDGDNNNPDPVSKDTAEEERSVSRGSEASHSDELGESGTSERKWKRKRRKHGGSDEIRSGESKSQPLIGLLDLIRSHPRGSLFERRLRSQEAKDYKSMVKQHLDIETIQRKLKQGCYDSSTLTFYRDLQLLFTNVIVFFPLSSAESMAAHELRAVVSQELRKETGEYGPTLIKRKVSAMDSGQADAETSDSSLSREKSSAPFVVCKRRSSVSTKTSPSSSSFSQKEETKEETLSEEKENIVTGVRSSRRANKVVAAAAAISNITKKGKSKNKQKQTESKTNSSNDNSTKQETGKTEKKMISSDKKKSVADFLKRLKNSPQKESKDLNKSSGGGKKDSKTKPRELRSSSVGKKKAGVEISPVKRAPGRPQKKTIEAGATATASAMGKRGRDTGSTGKDNKQPKKRIRM